MYSNLVQVGKKQYKPTSKKCTFLLFIIKEGIVQYDHTRDLITNSTGSLCIRYYCTNCRACRVQPDKICEFTLENDMRSTEIPANINGKPLGGVQIT